MGETVENSRNFKTTFRLMKRRELTDQKCWQTLRWSIWPCRCVLDNGVGPCGEWEALCRWHDAAQRLLFGIGAGECRYASCVRVELNESINCAKARFFIRATIRRNFVLPAEGEVDSNELQRIYCMFTVAGIRWGALDVIPNIIAITYIETVTM